MQEFGKRLMVEGGVEGLDMVLNVSIREGVYRNGRAIVVYITVNFSILLNDLTELQM